MRALIVDDEPIARVVLREELERVERLEVVGEAEDGSAALAQIAALKPDLLFLDIQMPGVGGFDVLDQLKSGFLPAVIMVTAYDEHAIRAFEAGAIGYLLKPIHPDRLMPAIERARRMAQHPAEVAEDIAKLQEILPAVVRGVPSVRKVVGKLGEEYFVLSLDEIFAFQAEGDLTWIYTAKQRYLATQNLTAMEQRLSGSSFRRIHRNALVNIEQIRKLGVLSSQRWLVTLNNGTELVVSKRQARNIRDVLHW